MLNSPVAIVCAKGLGDALLSMILAHNLTLHGLKTTTFSSVLCELREWFPNQTILPYPDFDDFFSTFSAFGTVIAADHASVTEANHFNNTLIILKEKAFNQKMTLVENLKNKAAELLSLRTTTRDNGITPPKNLRQRVYPKRVVIHPMSTSEKRTWPAQKFISLAIYLEKEGYEPFFCVSPSEIEEWKKRVHSDQLPFFPTLSETAGFIYESGFLIGNNSGLGHLASVLGIPTLSLFARRSYARLWRPGWGFGEVVTPLSLPLGGKFMRKYWKQLLSPQKVKKAFLSMTQRTQI